MADELDDAMLQGLHRPDQKPQRLGQDSDEVMSSMIDEYLEPPTSPLTDETKISQLLQDARDKGSVNLNLSNRDLVTLPDKFDALKSVET